MKKIMLRIVIYVCMFALFVGGMGAAGLVRSKSDFYGALRKEPVPPLHGVKKPEHDPGKPTVAVMLGNETTEGLDFMIPYELLSRTGAYNVYAVASDKEARSLTGGLDVVPHYTFKEMDALLGKSADIIVIPYMTMDRPGTFEPALQWIRQHADTTLLSICGGGGNLAATGLLDGKSGASHWQTLSFYPKVYPKVNWVNDRRYVQDGNIVTTAGVSSGIDGVLYVISQKLGEPAASKIAQDMKYPSYHFVKNPQMDPFYMDFRFATYLLNNAFHWNKTKAGVMLYNGVEEMALASVFDIYSDTGTTKVLSVAGTEQPVVTRHGLNLISRHTLGSIPQVDKMIVPGAKARTLAASEMQAWKEKGGTPHIQYVHSDSPDRFLFEVQLEDLAKQEDLLTAKHAVKRLEYRANEIRLEGRPFSLQTYGALLITALLSVLSAFWLNRRITRARKTALAARQ